MRVSQTESTTNFKAGYHVYFFSSDGKRIVSDKNMKKCLHYMEAHLNGAKRVKNPNRDLIDTFKYGKLRSDGTREGGDNDYVNYPVIRSVLDNTKDKIQGFMNVVTGYNAKEVSDVYGKKIGQSKGLSLKRTGTTSSFETSHAVKKYVDKAPDYAEKHAVYKNGERQAFGIAFTPVYYSKGANKGEVKDFVYHHCGFFDESAVLKKTQKS